MYHDPKFKMTPEQQACIDAALAPSPQDSPEVEQKKRAAAYEKMIRSVVVPDLFKPEK
jgi:hypothetical protein